MNDQPSVADMPASQQEICVDPRLMASLMEFSAAAGHEINNPLAVILGRVQLLRQQERDPARQQALATIAGQARRIRDMIGDVMLFAHPPEPELQSVSLQAICEPLRQSVGEYSRSVNPDNSTQLTAELPAAITLTADPAQLSTVLSELLRNAVHPYVAARRVQLTAAACTTLAGHCLITIQDDGRGFSATEAVHAFDPFFSGRQAGRGLGFGLCKAWRLAQLNGAQLRVKTRPQTVPLKPDQFRTAFQLRWPLASS